MAHTDTVSGSMCDAGVILVRIFHVQLFACVILKHEHAKVRWQDWSCVCSDDVHSHTDIAMYCHS